MSAGKSADSKGGPVPHCACSSQAMKLVRAIPKIGTFPELRTYRCERCGHVETVEAK
jgi:uncharacterized Zn finger protein